MNNWPPIRTTAGWHPAPADPIEQLREALTLIARPGCHHSSTERYRCFNDPQRARGAEYTGDAWCDACVAEEALRQDLGGNS